MFRAERFDHDSMNSQTSSPHDLSVATAAPIILRELRVEARSQSNYVLRLISAGGLAILFSLLIRGEAFPRTVWYAVPRIV